MIKRLLSAFLFALLSICGWSQNIPVSLRIHLRGVYESKISLIPLTGSNQFKSIVEVPGLKNGETTNFEVPTGELPGEFVLRFDYKEKKDSPSYPSEKRILIHMQSLELWLNPMYCNNQDSAWFQKGERENTTFTSFLNENKKNRSMISELQNFLMNYDDTKSKFYRQGIKEFEKRRKIYNKWLNNQYVKDTSLFAGNMYKFYYIPQIIWKGSQADREKSVINHYFDGIDFADPRITKTSQMNEWMNAYVNLNLKNATTIILRDSLISEAARAAIEKSRQGLPVVYGWMVDYFYKGFETSNIPAGMKVLKPYLDDSFCLTSKRMEIEKRLKGINTLVAGVVAPDILINDADGNPFELKLYDSNTKYILLVFWSAACSHCIEMVDAVYPWQLKPEIREKISVVAISLDETDAEIKAWMLKAKELSGWKHLRASEGIRSKVANDYFILSAPVMILLDAGTKQIITLPDTPGELAKAVQ